MASAVRKGLGADIGLSITGVAGPSEPEGKPAGTVFIGIATGRNPQVIASTHPGNRQRIRQRATTSALVELRKTLLNR